HQRVVRAEWSTSERRWTVLVQDTATGTTATRTCRFLYLCAGYYRYDEGYSPNWPGQDDFAGVVVHPQRWPADLDLTGRRVVVIGSGATAATVVPALADTAEHVTMLQRSPWYVLSLPTKDGVAAVLRRWLPESQAYAVVRWKNIRIATL